MIMWPERSVHADHHNTTNNHIHVAYGLQLILQPPIEQKKNGVADSDWPTKPHAQIHDNVTIGLYDSHSDGQTQMKIWNGIGSVKIEQDHRKMKIYQEVYTEKGAHNGHCTTKDIQRVLGVIKIYFTAKID